jgi:predicted transcriptional regulator
MGRKARQITDTELSLLTELWRLSTATVQELADGQYGNITQAKQATVRKLLDRLEAEECVTCDRTKWPHHYRAILKREDLVARRLQETADELFDGHLTSLLNHIVRYQKLTLKDRENLRKLLDEQDKKATDNRK